MTNNSEVTPKLPCGDCLKADVGTNGRPIMCRQVASVVISSLEMHCAVDITADERPEAEIAAAYIGKNIVVDLAVKSACKYLPKGKPLAQLSMLDRIQC
jgi:hypothetical protein